MILSYGLWDQVRVDHGKEFYLMLYVQEILAHFRTDTSRVPHLQSTSRQVSKQWMASKARLDIYIIMLLLTVISYLYRIIQWRGFGLRSIHELTIL